MEETVWKGSPSQVLNLGVFVVCGVGAALLVVPALLGLLGVWTLQPYLAGLLILLSLLPISAAALRWLRLKSRTYELTTERIVVSHGILSRQTDYMELYRVKDLTVLRPLFLRLFARGNIIVQTSDRTTPTIIIEAVPDPKAINDLIRRNVETCRQQKNVGELDMNEKINKS